MRCPFLLYVGYVDIHHTVLSWELFFVPWTPRNTLVLCLEMLRVYQLSTPRRMASEICSKMTSQMLDETVVTFSTSDEELGFWEVKDGWKCGQGEGVARISGWWFQIFCFHPYLGKIPILTNIFQMGWNHQLDMLFVFAALGLAEGGEGQGDLEVEQSGTNCQCSKSQEIIEVGNFYFFRLLFSLEDILSLPEFETSTSQRSRCFCKLMWVSYPSFLYLYPSRWSLFCTKKVKGVFFSRNTGTINLQKNLFFCLDFVQILYFSSYASKLLLGQLPEKNGDLTGQLPFYLLQVASMQLGGWMGSKAGPKNLHL